MSERTLLLAILAVLVALLGCAVAYIIFGTKTVETVTKGAAEMVDSRTEPYEMAKRLITKGLKHPGSAQFPEIGSPDVRVVASSNSVWRIASYVDSQNGFGALLRSEWVMAIQRQPDGSWLSKYVELEGEDVGDLEWFTGDPDGKLAEERVRKADQAAKDRANAEWARESEAKRRAQENAEEAAREAARVAKWSNAVNANFVAAETRKAKVEAARVAFLHKEATNGAGWAQLELGQRYLAEGNRPVAAHWIRAASTNRLPAAQKLLGELATTQ